MRKKIGWLVLGVLSVALVGAGPRQAPDRAASQRESALLFAPMTLKSGEPVTLIMFDVPVEPPPFTPSPCRADVRLINAQGDLVGNAIERDLLPGQSVDKVLYRKDPEESPTARPEIRLTGQNARSCAGVTAALQVGSEAGPTRMLAPAASTQVDPGPPELAGLAPVVLDSEGSPQLQLVNAGDLTSRVFPPSPCVFDVQFFGVDADTVSESNHLAPGASMVVRYDGAATVVQPVVWANGGSCKSLLASGELLNADGNVIGYSPRMGSVLGSAN